MPAENFSVTATRAGITPFYTDSNPTQTGSRRTGYGYRVTMQLHLANDITKRLAFDTIKAGRAFRAWAAYRKELSMDTSTIDATCSILLVVIGIIGLVLVKRE